MKLTTLVITKQTEDNGLTTIVIDGKKLYSLSQVADELVRLASKHPELLLADVLLNSLARRKGERK